MATIVMKFGGTSLQTDQQIETVAQHVVAEQRRGSSVVVVVSARGHTTDEIRSTVRACGGPNTPEEILDFAGIAGELISASCLASTIKKMGVEVEVADGRGIELIAGGNYGDGRVEKIKNPDLITTALGKDKVVVLAAYAGITNEGKIITLGRGGSDTFAVAVAAVIEADVCQIYTDVPGFFAIDPRFVPSAKMFCRLPYWQAMALCSAGVQVLKERCIAIASEFNVLVQVLLSPSFDDSKWRELGVNIERGTLLSRGASRNQMEATNLDQTGAAINSEITVFNITNLPNRSGISNAIFSQLKKVIIGNLAQAIPPVGQEANISFYVRLEDAGRTAAILGEIKLENLKVEQYDNLACLTLVDSRMVNGSGWIDRATGALGAKNINIEMHSTSGPNITIMVARDVVKQAALAIAEEFGLCN